jgi:hypothetical protein
VHHQYLASTPQLIPWPQVQVNSSSYQRSYLLALQIHLDTTLQTMK